MKKTQRVQTILEIFERWGKLDKKAIDKHFATKASLELTAALKRAIYRDLDELVNHNRLNIEYFHRDNTPIDDYNPEVHKNVVSKWSLTGSENKILGQNYLGKLNSQIYVPKLLKNDVSITQGAGAPTEMHISLYFVLSGTFLALNVHKDAIPLKIHFCRNTNLIGPKLIETFEQEFGFRSIMFHVPNSTVSSYDPGNKKKGQLVLELNESNIHLEDLNSSNGSKVSKINNKTAEQIIKDGSILGNQTVKNVWADSANDMIFEQLTQKQTADLPSLINLANDFTFLVK